jgi:hypothetical protein
VTPPVSQSDFHVFECVDGVRIPGENGIDQAALLDLLEETDGFLNSATTFSDRRDYRDCPTRSRFAAYGLLKEQGVELGTAGKRAYGQQRYENRVDLFNAVDMIFRFFLPPTFEGPTIGKFWGAMDRIVEVS